MSEPTEEERDVIELALDQLVEEGKAFYCAICEGYVDARFTERHFDRHQKGEL